MTWAQGPQVHPRVPPQQVSHPDMGTILRKLAETEMESFDEKAVLTGDSGRLVAGG